MTPMSVHYSKGLAIPMVVVGALLLLLTLASGQWVSAAAGAILTLLGVLMLVNPMVRIDANEVQLLNPLGMTVKRRPVSSPADLRIEGKKLYHVPTGKKVASLGFGVRGSDVEQLRAQMTSPAG